MKKTVKNQIKIAIPAINLLEKTAIIAKPIMI